MFFKKTNKSLKQSLKKHKTYLYKLTLNKQFVSMKHLKSNLSFFNSESYKMKKHLLLLNERKSLNNSLRRYPLFLRNYKRNLNLFHGSTKVLNLNFPRNRFFPSFRTLKGETYTFLSLGMFSKYFTKNKSFFKTKTMYLLLAGFLRKMLLFSSLKFLYMIVTKTPAFLKEIMSSINSPVVSNYKNPFNSDININEKLVINPFKFSFFLFINNKPYGKVKVKKKGRLKRKVTKRLTKMNKVLD